ncbi:MAG: hypothetical protein MGF17_16480, partial [Trichodesmium sp. MAG_R04]|nr:hypothetical protein [Trichodesmium sp. MAG_R04]
QNLGGSKHFKCPHCGHSMPRDWNGALGIFLKALRDTANVMVVPSRCYEGFSQLLAGIAGLDVFAYN